MKKIQFNKVSQASFVQSNPDLGITFFVENAIFAVYSKVLDLYGYGRNEVEAMESFNIVLAEFYEYRSEKGVTGLR